MSMRATKAQRYAQYYLARFRADVEAKAEALIKARNRLEIAEHEHATGRMVTEEPDGIPAILRGNDRRA